MSFERPAAAVFLLLLSLAPRARAQEVAVTFDDLPAHAPMPAGTTREEVARKILAALKNAGLPEVYGFINAGKLEAHPEDLAVLKLWREAGQPLANHTYTHMNLNENPAALFEENVQRNEPALKSLMPSGDWHWFRYPYLNEGETLEKRREARRYLQANHYRIAQVTLDFEDYAWNGAYARCADKKDEKSVAWLRESYLATAAEYMALGRKVSQEIFHRDIKYVLLMHVGAFDAEMLPRLLEQMKRQGFRFVSLEEAESDPAYQIDPDIPLNDGYTLLDQIVEARHLTTPPHAEKPMKELREICR